MAQSLKNTFISGTFWTASENVIFTILGVIQLAITSRVLSSEDFGVYAIATFFSGLGTIAFSMGLGPALIQKKGNIEEYLDTAWSANLLVALIATILLEVLISPICNLYYHNSSAILPSMVIMLSVLFSAGMNPAIVCYQRDIKLKKYFYLRVFPKLLSFVLIIVCVYLLKSYWGLIIALLSEYLFRMVYSFFIYPHKVRFKIDASKFKELYSFGGWLQLKNVFSWFAGNIDVAIVGNILGTHQLGIYNRAQTISSYPRTFVNGVIDNVAFPLYSKISDDKTRVNAILIQVQNIILLLLSLMGIAVILYAEPLVELVLGPNWGEMVDPFRIIFTAYLFQTLLFSFNPVLRAFGFTRQEFVFYVIKMAVMIALLYPFTIKLGLVGAGYAILLAVILVFPYLLIILKKRIGINLFPLFISTLVSIITTWITIEIFNFIVITYGYWWVLLLILSLCFSCLLFIAVAALFKVGPGLVLISLLKAVEKKQKQ